jgi:hypothetical protein
LVCSSIASVAGTNSNLDKLHELMMKNNIQYLTFNSASKGATYVTDGGINAKPDQIFKDKNFKEVADNLDGITPNEIYLAGLKEVTVINDQHKKKIPKLQIIISKSRYTLILRIRVK